MRIAHLACGLMAALGWSTVLADWEIVPDVTFAVGANDNPRLDDSDLSTADTGTARSAWIDARAAMSNFTERGGVYFEPRLRKDSYADSGDKELESDDLFLTLRTERRSARGGRGGVNGYFSRESILTSELLEAAPTDPDVPDPVPIDTGLLAQPDEHRTRFTIAPFFESRLSERSSFLLDAQVQDVSYSGPPVGGRTDFRNNQLGVGIARNVNDRNRATARLLLGKFEADATSNETDTVGVEGSFERTLSEIWSFALTTGLQRSEITFVRGGVPGEEVDTSVTLGLGFRKRTELARLNIDLQRLVAPNASGFLEERDQFRIALDRQLSPRLTGDIAVRLIDSGTLGDIQAFDREYVRLSLGLRWALTPQWSLDGGLDTIRQEFAGRAGDATSNRVRLGMTYRGLSRRGAF